MLYPKVGRFWQGSTTDVSTDLGLPSRAMKIASYIFYGLAGLSALAGIAAASFAKEQLGHVFGTGTLFVYGGATLLSLLIAVTSKNLAARKI